MLNHMVHLQSCSSYVIGDVIIDLRRRTVHIEGRDIAFTHKEFSILHFFAAHCGWALSKQQIIDAVWTSDADVNYHAVENAVYRIRKKLRSSNRVKIQTMVGYGYKLMVLDHDG